MRWRPEAAADPWQVRSSKSEVYEFAVLLDSEDPESQHRRGGVKEERPQPRAVERPSDSSIGVIVTHDGLRVRREPRDGGIDADEDCVGHFATAEGDLRRARHLRQHVKRA